MAWMPEYAIILVISTIIDFFCGYKMNSITEQAQKKSYLYLSLISNLGILFTFKYFNFFKTISTDILAQFHIEQALPTFPLLLPMGISFYTFQTMSYSIDVYHEKVKAEKHLGIFALFVTFFPQLVAGPIERSGNLLPQFYKHTKFEYERITSGLKLMAWGFFKKIVIADRLAQFVNYVYNDPYEYQGIYLVTATIFFAFQIYCDFSAYSDIAIGSARVLGFDLMKNFNRPYFSKSIDEFWKNWHISLSTWFKDYIYIPLGGNRVVKWRWYYNLFITFLISGFWHGANWTFVVWGALHGFYLVFSHATKNIRNNLAMRSNLVNYPRTFKSKMAKKITTASGSKLMEKPDTMTADLSNDSEIIQKLQRNRNILFGVVAVLVLAVGGWLGYSYYKQTKTAEAQTYMFPAVYYFEADSLNKALKGDGNNDGLETIANDYGMTDAGNLAQFYTGVAYLKQGQFDNAINYLKDFKSSDLLIQARAYALVGDAYMEKGQAGEAINYYEKAANYKTNAFFTPQYLMKLGLAQETNNNSSEAIQTYDKIINEYPNSSEITNAKKYKSKLQGIAGK